MDQQHGLRYKEIFDNGLLRLRELVEKTSVLLTPSQRRRLVQRNPIHSHLASNYQGCAHRQ